MRRNPHADTRRPKSSHNFKNNIFQSKIGWQMLCQTQQQDCRGKNCKGNKNQRQRPKNIFFFKAASAKNRIALTF